MWKYKSTSEIPWEFIHFHGFSFTCHGNFHGSNFTSMYFHETFDGRDCGRPVRCLGSGWLVGLRRLLRRATYNSAPCRWEKGAMWDQIRVESRYRVGAGCQLGVEYLIDAASLAAYTTPMEVNPTVMEVHPLPLELMKSSH